MVCLSVEPKRILVACYHSYIDTSSGAAISLRDMMEALAGNGWAVRVLSGPKLDFEGAKTNHELLHEQGITYSSHRASSGGQTFSLSMFSTGGVDCGLWTPEQPQADPDQHVGNAWLSSFRELLDAWRPDVVITYGGFWMTGPMLRSAKKAGAKTVFYLCNFAYTDRSLFNNVDTTIVLSRYHADWCEEHLGVNGTPVYPLMPPQRYRCEPDPPQRYVTFVNPHPHKGVYIVAKIIEVMKVERPDIPFLIVESRASTHWLAKSGADLSAANLFRMRNTPDPRDYLRCTRLLLAPSVWQESFGRVAAEAMMNGIPVIGSDRGALPEVIGDPSLLVELPAWMTHEPAATFARTWDDASAFHQSRSDDIR